MYEKYKPVFATEYNVFWEKDEEKQNASIKMEDITLTINKKSKSCQKIQVETKDPKFDGVVDVKLSYESSKTKRFLKTLNINRYIYINDTTGKKVMTVSTKPINYNIPNTSDEYYVPVTIVDGKGEIELKSYPTQDTKLDIKSADIMNVFDVNFKYCVLSKDHKIDGNTLYIDNTNENKVILQDVKQVRINDIVQNVVKYEETKSYIKLEVDANANTFAYPNFFEVIK